MPRNLWCHASERHNSTGNQLESLGEKTSILSRMMFFLWMQEHSPGCGVNVESKAPGFLRPKEWHGKKFAGLFCCWQEQWVITNVNHPIKEHRYNFNNSLNWLPCCICWFLRIYIELAAKVNHVAFLLCLSFKSNLNGKKKLICASSITYNPGLHGE